MPSFCWRCGCKVPEGRIECAIHNSVKVTYSSAREWKLIDWEKVETLDEMKKVLHIIGLRVLVGSEAWKELFDFLED